MKTSICAFLMLVASPVFAQDEDLAPQQEQQPIRRQTSLRRDPMDDAGPALSGTVTPTPDMWYYSQENRRHDNPQLAVRRKAEARASQRLGRIESLAWQGQSGGRPVLSPSGMYNSFGQFGVFNPYYWRTSYYTGNMLFQPIAVTR
jgi:hypothetical protein